MSENSLSYELKVLYPPEEQRSVQLDSQGVLIGRGEESHLRFEDEWISRQHCRVWLDGETIWLEDLQSTNGTFLDGQLVDKQNILPGSKVQLGKVVLSVELINPQANTLNFPSAQTPQETPEPSESGSDGKAMGTTEPTEAETLAQSASETPENEAPAETTENSNEDFEFETEEQGSEENLSEAFDEETQGADEEPSTYGELAGSLKIWTSQLDSPQNAALFKIKVINLSDFEETPGAAAIRFLHLEMNELLQSEKITDEWIAELDSADFLFAVHSMTAEQADGFAKDLQQLIQKQIFSYQGEILQIQVKVGAVVTHFADVDWAGVLEQLDEAVNLASQSDKTHLLMVN